MKKTNTLYWIFTILFSVFMIFTAVPDIILAEEAVTFMNHLGYNNNFIIFIGVAKVLGGLAILIPGFPRIKEWAYAGLFFDLIGAIYSIAATDGLNPGMTFILLPIIIGALSYIYHHKRIAAKVV
jgi:uncharacterized membrane protein YphA (DoxX/SURF4 family)